MLFNYFNIYSFKMFKGATNPCQTYVYGMKGGRLWDERWTFMG